MYLQGRLGVTACGGVPLHGPAPASGNVSTCPDRVTRFIKANTRLNVFSNINGTIVVNGVNVTVPSPNRYVSTEAVAAPANLIDNQRFFVSQQYADFLTAQPEPDEGV